ASPRPVARPRPTRRCSGVRIGRWELLREVARGGTGAVHLARDGEGRQAAVKLLLAGRAATPVQRQRFRREVEALGRVRHPNVVELLDAGEEQGVPWLALAWVEGETLQARLARAGPLDPEEAAGLVAELAR